MPPYDAGQFGACGRQLHDKNTQQSNVKTHEAEGILEGESLHIGVLGVGGRHGDAMERAEMNFLFRSALNLLHFNHDEK